MINQFYTTKDATGQLFVENRRRAITWLKIEPQVVSALNTPEKQGYLSLQLAIGQKRSPLSKPLAGHLKSAKLDHSPRWLREVVLSEPTELEVGTSLPLDQIVAVGDTVKVSGTSKGKGFAGVMKRHHFHGGPRTHGQSDRARAPGSIGRGTTPGRVVKGKKMAGHMGDENVSVKNLTVLALDLENHKLAVSGPVPGANGGLITVTVLKKNES